MSPVIGLPMAPFASAPAPASDASTPPSSYDRERIRARRSRIVYILPWRTSHNASPLTNTSCINHTLAPCSVRSKSPLLFWHCLSRRHPLLVPELPRPDISPYSATSLQLLFSHCRAQHSRMISPPARLLGLS